MPALTTIAVGRTIFSAMIGRHDQFVNERSRLVRELKELHEDMAMQENRIRTGHSARGSITPLVSGAKSLQEDLWMLENCVRNTRGNTL